MSTPEPNTEPHPSEADDDAAEATPGQTRRGISEWAVVLALVALIIAVAWSQFGSLFGASTEGAGAGAGGMQVEGEGFTVGGTAMSALTEDGPVVDDPAVNTVRSRDDTPSDSPRDDDEPSDTPNDQPSSGEE